MIAPLLDHDLSFFQTIKDFPVEACVARRINSFSVIETMPAVILTRGVSPDNSAEMTAKVVRNWLGKIGARTLYIEPGSPWENGYCESFNNGKLRDECGRRAERCANW